MKFKLLLTGTSITLFLWVMAVAVMAQEEVPASYAGLENPSQWDDASAREAGEELYKQSCLGCHGIDGSNIANSNFSDTDYPQRLEGKADFYFWKLSEGELDKGMPPYQSSLSEEQRWQMLTYLWSLGKVEVLPEETPLEATPPPANTPVDKAQNPVKIPEKEVSYRLLMIAPERAQAGRPLFLTAYVRDSEENPVAGATVKFFNRVDFFASGLLKIGEALTDEEGVAILEYTPRQAGETDIVTRYEAVETITMLTVAESEVPFYRPEAGISLLSAGEDVFIGPESALELEEGSTAPTSAFRLPGGIFSWLLLVIVAVMFIWATYFRVLYQVFGIPVRGEIGDTDTRLVPLIGLVVVAALGALLVLMLITGPYSHFHLTG